MFGSEFVSSIGVVIKNSFGMDAITCVAAVYDCRKHHGEMAMVTGRYSRRSVADGLRHMGEHLRPARSQKSNNEKNSYGEKDDVQHSRVIECDGRFDNLCAPLMRN